jgi:hypothetical protein
MWFPFYKFHKEFSGPPKGKTGVDLVSASDRTGERNEDSQDSWSELWNPREKNLSSWRLTDKSHPEASLIILDKK